MFWNTVMKQGFFKRILKPFKKNKLVLFSFIATVLGVLVLSQVIFWISLQNKIVITYNQPRDRQDRTGDFDIFMEIPVRSDGQKNCWQLDDGSWGSQYDIHINNKGKYPFVDWHLTMTVPPESRIDSSWNGEYTQAPGLIYVKGDPSALNLTVLPDDSIKIGYVLYTNVLMQSSDFVLTGRFLRNLWRDRIFLITLGTVILFTLVFIVSIILYVFVQRQAEKDDERVMSLLRLCARFIDVRDEYTKMHSSHVAEYSKKIAEVLGYDEDFQKNIYYMGMMHDVGKVLIPREILCKTDRLTDEEWQEMKEHTTYGAEILSGFRDVPGIQEAALYHHERWDGKGYVRGLQGKEIPIQARIIGVADSYDAMHTDRSYRARLSDEVILAEFEKGRGTQFDPEVVDAMIKLLKSNALAKTSEN